MVDLGQGMVPVDEREAPVTPRRWEELFEEDGNVKESAIRGVDMDRWNESFENCSPDYLAIDEA